MEDVINKPDNQFKDILNDLVDFSKDSQEKSALIEEVCRSNHTTKPAASLNSSTYSSAASSSSSTSSDSSTNSASSSSSSSTLSSPSQTNGDAAGKKPNLSNSDYDKLEVAKMEDLGKRARILEHRIAHTGQKTADNGHGPSAVSSHSDIRSTSLQNFSSSSSSSLTYTLNFMPQNRIQPARTQYNLSDATNKPTNGTTNTNDSANTVSSWKTISGKRDKRRRKPVEQPVLSQHIPGHKGEQEVDWLVNFIESKASATNNINNIAKKNNKSTRVQSKRSSNQTTESNNRDIQQRKSNLNPSTTNTSSSNKSIQHRSQLTQKHSSSSEESDDAMTDTHQINQRKVQPSRATHQSQLTKQHQQRKQTKVTERRDEAIKTSEQKSSSPQRRTPSVKTNKLELDEAVVTFAEHIELNDDEKLDKRYIFGFFDEQHRQPSNQSSITQVKTTKPMLTHNETLNAISEPNHISQKQRSKYLKPSLKSDRRLYRFHDNLDASSFNYRQILEYISNCKYETPC